MCFLFNFFLPTWLSCFTVLLPIRIYVPLSFSSILLPLPNSLYYSIPLSIYLFISLFIFFSVPLYLSFSLSTYVTVHPSIFLSFFLSFFFSLFIFQLLGKAVDMWSMGILLYALLCGCFPFRAKSYPDLYRKIARGTIVFDNLLHS